MGNGNNENVNLNTPEVPIGPTKPVTGLVWRIISCVAFFILGFNLSMTAFFSELPWFGYHTILEVLLSSLTGLFGYFVFPSLLLKVKNWFEAVIRETIRSIVASFWDQQSKRIQEARREKHKKKAENEAQALKRELENAVLLDTSVLVDGRIVDLLKSGFFNGPFIVPQNVIHELQTIADSKDVIKRQRGRRGLDTARDVRKMAKVLMPEIKSKDKEVDKQLVSFAREHKVKLMTMDFNLNKVAAISGIKVLNINDLVNALKTVLLPGEVVKMKIVQQGKEKQQGIGFLPDGTMVIVEEARTKVGEEVDVKVVKTIQSSAGRMIFCEMVATEIPKESFTN
jgi:uncharacterized protein YacL